MGRLRASTQFAAVAAIVGLVAVVVGYELNSHTPDADGANIGAGALIFLGLLFLVIALVVVGASAMTRRRKRPSAGQ
jgi:hypothetical protein